MLLFGAFVRAAPMALVAVVISWILSRILDPIIDVMLVNASSDHWLVQAFQALNSEALFLLLLSIGLMLIARAVREGRGAV